MCQIHIVDSVGIFGKSDGAQKHFVYFVGFAKCVMNTAKVNKIESGSPDNEKRLRVLDALCVSEIDELAAFICHCKLANSNKIAVNVS